MLGLVILLWCVYLSDCVVRQHKGYWLLRRGIGRPLHAVAGPDTQLLGERVGIGWTPLLPWHVAYVFTGRDAHLQRARTRLDGLDTRTRWLRHAAGALFVWVMVVLPLLVLSGRFLPVFKLWTLVAGAAWIATYVLFFRTYRHIHDRQPPFETWLTMTLSPVSLMRAPSAAAFTAARDIHPVAAAAVLCDDDEFLRMARMWFFDEPDGRSTIEAIATERGLGPRLSAGPASWEAGVVLFCPRCHATYTEGATQCSDCGPIGLRPLAT